MNDLTQERSGGDNLAPRASTGIHGLDDILQGGLPCNHVFLVEGEPGTGKTTLGLQFLLEGARIGEKVLYVTLSESEEEIRGVAKSHGWSLDGVSLIEFTPHEDSLRPEDQYSAFHPSEIELQDTTQAILKRLDALQPQRVVLDSLSEIRLLARDSLRYRRQILALKHFFANRKCTVLLLDDRTAGPDGQQLQSIAHGVLMLDKLPRDFGNIRRRLQVAKLRGSSFREGYHDYNIETGGVVVFPRLIASEHRDATFDNFVASGIPELDALWGGGIERGTNTLLIGPAGAGKTTLTMAYSSAAAARNEKVHVFLFDEGILSAINRADKLGMKLGRARAEGLVAFDQVDPAELSPGELIHNIRKTVETGTKLVVLDSLNGLLAAMPGEEHLVLHMHELLSYLSQKGVTTLLVLSQAGILVPTLASPVDLSYLADNMLLLRYFEAEGRVRKAVSVVKKRGGYHEPTIRELRFTDSHLSVGEPLTQFQGIMSGIPSFTGSQSELGEASGGYHQS